MLGVTRVYLILHCALPPGCPSRCGLAACLLCASRLYKLVALEDKRLDFAPACDLRCVQNDTASITRVGLKARVARNKRGRLCWLKSERDLTAPALVLAGGEQLALHVEPAFPK